MSNDIDRENEASGLTQITGGDEAFKADVSQDDAGSKNLHVLAKIDEGSVGISSSLRIFETKTGISINGAGYTTIYSNTGISSNVSGFMLKCSTANYNVRLTIDCEIVFDVDVNFLSTFVNWNNSSNPSSMISSNSADNAFYFTPLIGIIALNSVDISVRSNQGNRQVTGSYIQVAEI
jgi:hypothetical protein